MHGAGMQGGSLASAPKSRQRGAGARKPSRTISGRSISQSSSGTGGRRQEAGPRRITARGHGVTSIGASGGGCNSSARVPWCASSRRHGRPTAAAWKRHHLEWLARQLHPRRCAFARAARDGTAALLLPHPLRQLPLLFLPLHPLLAPAAWNTTAAECRPSWTNVRHT